MGLKVLCFVCVVFVVAGCASDEDHGGKEQAAVAAAEKWLERVDAGEYRTSWQEASEVFRASMTADRWEQSMRKVHAPLGKLLSREVRSKKYMSPLPGAPDGEYVIVEFDASYENRRQAVETVTPMLEKSGEWRVSGYYMQ